MNKEDIRLTLRKLGVEPSKDFGQSFLADLGVIEDIIDFGRVGKDDHVVEIGPGLGALTRELASLAKSLTVIEIESAFARHIKRILPNVEVIEEDVRTVDLSEIGEKLLVYGNLPYVFSTDILFHLVNYSKQIKRAVLMFQKEYAERLYASAGSKKFSSLTLQLAIHAKIKPGPIIQGNCFQPHVAVESQVVELTFLPEPLLTGDAMFTYQRLVSAVFYKRRKKILNSIREAQAFDEQQIQKLISTEGFDPNARAEEITQEQYIKYAKALSQLL